MLRDLTSTPRRILMTLDAVGGVWRYAMELARGLAAEGCAVSFIGQGPEPNEGQRREVDAVPGARLTWLSEPLDWMAEGPDEVAGLPARLADLARTEQVDLMHLNLPSQAAGLQAPCPVVVVSHSCVVTWWNSMRGSPLPPEWEWRRRLNRAGFDAAGLVLAPSRSHADALVASYGPIKRLQVMHNGVAASPRHGTEKKRQVFAVARWWDEAKGGAMLDAAAEASPWPVLMAGSVRGPQGQAFAASHAQALGSLPHARVRALMAESAILVSPSRYEPFGLAAVEGALAENALVVADIPTYRELWDGAALFAAPDSPAAFAACIGRLAGDNMLRREMSERARDRAASYAPRQQLSHMLDAYAAATAADAPIHRMAG